MTDLDQSRFVRRDRLSAVKKNTQIFLVTVGMVILLSSAQNAADHALLLVNITKQTNYAGARQQSAQMPYGRG